MCASLIYALREALLMVEEEGLGPLAGKIWRVELMGNSSTIALVTLMLSALEDALAALAVKSTIS